MDHRSDSRRVPCKARQRRSLRWSQTDFDPYAVLDALRAGGDVDKIPQSVEFVLQALIEVEAIEASL